MSSDLVTVTGSYDLMGVNGSVLPAAVDVPLTDERDNLRCRVLAGELRLEESGTYRLAMTARWDSGRGTAYTRVVESAGTWRFLASALDDRSGEITLCPAGGRSTSAAVTRLSLVHRALVPGAGPEGVELTWVYLKRAGPRGYAGC